MPKCSCSVRGCRTTSQQPNVTMHKLPIHEEKRKQWINIIGSENLNPNHKVKYVCSLHFEKDSIKRVGGRNRLKDDALPSEFHLPYTRADLTKQLFDQQEQTLNTDSVDQNDKLVLTTAKVEMEIQRDPLAETSESLVCRICLATDRKMYYLHSDRIHLYEQITGVTFEPDDLLPKSVCWECGHCMSKYVAFKTKVITSQHVLQEILSSVGLITPTTIGSVDRTQFNLQSTLTCTDVQCLCVSEEEEENCVNIDDVHGNSDHDDNNEIFDDLKDHVADDFVDDKQSVNNEMLANLDNDIILVVLETESNDSVKHFTDLYNKSNNLYEGNTEASGKQNDKSFIQNSNDKRERRSTGCETDHDINSDIESADITEENENLENSAKLQSNGKSCNEKSNITRKRKSTALDLDIENPAKQPYTNNKTKLRKSKDFKGIKESKEISTISRKAKTVRVKKYIPSMVSKIDKNILNLTRLSFDEQLAELEMRKLNYCKSEFMCTLCFMGFSDDNSFNRHMEKHSESQGIHECKLCKLHFRSNRRLQDHTRTHLYKINCKKCDFKSNRLTSSIRHQNHHKGKQFDCVRCDRTFTHESSYLNHLRNSHPSNVSCEYCGYYFVNERGLHLHKSIVHRDQPPIPEDSPYCDECDIRFFSQTAFDTHKGRKSTRNKEINRANRTWRPFADGPKPCEQCGQKLHGPRAYFEHIKKEHKGQNRAFYYDRKAQICMCEICGKITKNQSSLNMHKYIHFATKQFKCERCGQQFRVLTTLKKHQKERCDNARVPHPCTLCDKVLTNKGNLKRHMITHAGVRAYKCEFCDKTFVHLSNKNIHIDYVHKKKPWPKRNKGVRKGPKRQVCKYHK